MAKKRNIKNVLAVLYDLKMTPPILTMFNIKQGRKSEAVFAEPSLYEECTR